VSADIRYENRRRVYAPSGTRYPDRRARYAAYIPPSVRDAASVRVCNIMVEEVLSDAGTRTGWRATGAGFDGVTYAFSVGRTRDHAVEGLLTRPIAVDADA
jgi:hypothetical protein